jgi:orotate phosphoribosyltransferase
MGLFTSFVRVICEHKAVDADVIAGGETAGIPFAAYVAQTLSKPMIYVRKAKKEHGIGSLIEGQLKEGSRVLLVEDLITDAGSKLHFIEAVQDAGGVVNNVLVLFDREQGGRRILEEQGIKLHAVTDMGTALTVAKNSGLLSKMNLKSVSEYMKDMRAWHKKRGLCYLVEE